MNNKIIKNILLLGTEEDILQLAHIITAKIRLDEEMNILAEKNEMQEAQKKQLEQKNE